MPRKPPPPQGLVLTLLRLLRGWSQKELAEAAGLSRGLLSEYETGATELTRERLGTLVALLKWPREIVDLALAALELIAPLAEGPASPLAPGPEERRIIGRAAARAAREAAEGVYAGLTREVREEKARQARQAAAIQWERLKRFSREDRQVLVRESREYQAPFLCERICEDSAKAAASSAGLALELAELAVHAARHAQCPPAWQSRLQGYAWAFLGNARRVANNLPAADEAFARAWDLWRAEGPPEDEFLPEWRLLDLEASLRREQRRFGEALALLDQAAARPGGVAAMGRILLKKEFVLEQMGAIEEAIAVLREAVPFVESSEDTRLLFALRFETVKNLCHLGRSAEAAELLPEVRTLAVKLCNELDLVRVLWLQARIFAGQEAFQDAVAAFGQVRREFAARELAYDFALASLELAVLWLAQEHSGEVKALARQMLWIFQSHGIHREALAALRLFQKAAEKEELTLELARRFVNYLYRAQRNPSLRFESEEAPEP